MLPNQHEQKALDLHLVALGRLLMFQQAGTGPLSVLRRHVFLDASRAAFKASKTLVTLDMVAGGRDNTEASIRLVLRSKANALVNKFSNDGIRFQDLGAAHSQMVDSHHARYVRKLRIDKPYEFDNQKLVVTGKIDSKDLEE